MKAATWRPQSQLACHRSEEQAKLPGMCQVYDLLYVNLAFLTGGLWRHLRRSFRSSDTISYHSLACLAASAWCLRDNLELASPLTLWVHGRARMLSDTNIVAGEPATLMLLGMQFFSHKVRQVTTTHLRRTNIAQVIASDGVPPASIATPEISASGDNNARQHHLSTPRCAGMSWIFAEHASLTYQPSNVPCRRASPDLAASNSSPVEHPRARYPSYAPALPLHSLYLPERL